MMRRRSCQTSLNWSRKRMRHCRILVNGTRMIQEQLNPRLAGGIRYIRAHAHQPFRDQEICIISLFSIVQIWVLRVKTAFLQFLVDILSCGSAYFCWSGSRKPKCSGSNGSRWKALLRINLFRRESSGEGCNYSICGYITVYEYYAYGRQVSVIINSYLMLLILKDLL